MTEAAARSLDTRLGVVRTAGLSVQDSDVIRHLSLELRKPITSLESIACYLGLVSPGEDKAAPHVERLRRIAERMNWVINDTFHLLEDPPPAPPILDLHELISSILAERAARNESILRTDFAEQEALIRMDAPGTAHLIRTLILSVTHLAGKEESVLRTMVSPQTVQLEVRIPGAAIPKDHLESYFGFRQPGWQEGAYSLAGSRRIAQAYGAEILASALPQGSGFTCTFPSGA